MTEERWRTFEMSAELWSGSVAAFAERENEILAECEQVARQDPRAFVEVGAVTVPTTDTVYVRGVYEVTEG